MESMDVQQVRRTLTRVGVVLSSDNTFPPVTLVLAGGAAGMLGGLLSTSRVTIDCAVMWSDAGDAWDRLERAAVQVASELRLMDSWLNRKCRIFAGNLALDWWDRCEPVGIFGVLTVKRISRLDLLASKIVSAPRRPQDLKDIVSMAPTESELDLLEQHIDRVESEDLDRTSFEKQRKIIGTLRGVK